MQGGCALWPCYCVCWHLHGSQTRRLSAHRLDQRNSDEIVPLKQLYLASTKLRHAPCTVAVLCAVVVCAVATCAKAQAPAAWQSASAAQAVAPTASAAMPEPIFWKQNLFLIPYQWNSAADPSAAQAVWLYVSRDQGTSWQKISEAKPNVKAFNYHAEADGEYWFAIRTIDRSGQPRPAGPMQPELRVVVDTTMPEIEELRTTPLADGRIDIRWSATDRNLDANSLRIEVQTDASDTWHTVPTTVSAPDAYDTMTSRTTWAPPPGSRASAVRATVSDRAGNPAFFQTEAGAIAPGPIARAPLPTLTAEPGNIPSVPNPQTSAWNSDPFKPLGPAPSFGHERDELVPAAPPLASPPPTSGWTSPSAVPADPYGTDQPASQPWAADVSAPVPYRLANSGRTTGAAPANAATTYGNPVVSSDPYAPKPADRYAQSQAHGLVPVDASDAPAMAPPPRTFATAPDHSSVEPFHQASISHSAVPPKDNSLKYFKFENDFAPESGPRPGPTEPAKVSTLDPRPDWSGNSPSLFERWGVQVPRGVEPKFVNSRTFSLEYQVEDVGGWGVSKVQLWGTRDGGQTWHYYAEDDDNRSPLNVTVDGEGLYGFRIIVQSAAGPGGFAPQSGDEPELWVGVDLHRPQAELLSVEPGTGNLSDHLVLRWRADDDNLEPRPISLFYSSRPTGPWSAAATGLQNTGEYAWRMERYVPTQFYLRLEVRDTAGNLAAYQTVEPIRLDRPQPTGTLRGVDSVDPTAAAPGFSTH